MYSKHDKLHSVQRWLLQIIYTDLKSFFFKFSLVYLSIYMVPYVDIIGVCHSVSILWEIWCCLNVMWSGCTSISSAC